MDIPGVIAEGEHLSDEQKARGAALHVARNVLAARNPLGSGKTDAVDLVMVARWIVGGSDPWVVDELSRGMRDRTGGWCAPSTTTL